MITVKVFPNNPLDENTYLLYDESKEAVIIDCGALTKDERRTIHQYVQEHSLEPAHFLLTHGHFDHIFGAQWVYDTFGLSPSILEPDLPLYNKGCMQLLEMFGTHLQFSVPNPGKILHDNEEILFGEGIKVKAVATPGHTPGGCCYYISGASPIIFTGDSLFKGGIGRTDFPGGSYEALTKSLKEKVLTLPSSTIVYPGHGASSTIAAEKASPFF